MHVLIYLAILISSASTYDWSYDSNKDAQFVVIRQSCPVYNDPLDDHYIPLLLTITKSGFSYVDYLGNTKKVSAAGLIFAHPSQAPRMAYKPDSNTNLTLLVGNFTLVSNFKHGLTDLQVDMTLDSGKHSCTYTLSALNSIIMKALTPFLLCLVVCLLL